MDNNTIKTNLQAASKELTDLIGLFNQDQFNVIPYQDSWTAGQLAQHVKLFTAGFADMINGPVEDTTRPPDQLVEQIKKDFLNFDIKMQSPDFVAPRVDNYNREALLKSLEEIQAGIMNAIGEADLTKTCTAFKIPVYGFFTRYESAYFILYHTQRHIHQLKKIRDKVLPAIAA